MINNKALISHDVKYPLGIVRIKGDHEYLTGITFAKKSFSPKSSKMILPEPIRACADFFEQYFNGRHIPDGAYMLRYLDIDGLSGKGRLILETLLSVKAGSVITYGELARKAGNSGAARFAGNMMARNPFPILIPCHRVVRAGGGIGNYSGGVNIKEWLLTHEGIIIEKGKIQLCCL